MVQTNFALDETARDIVSQVLTARRWTPSHLPTRLKTRTDGQTAMAPILTALPQGRNLTQAIARMFAQLPHLMREAIAPEPARTWTALVGHNARVLQGEIEPLMTALAEATVGHARLGQVFQEAAAAFQEEAARFEKELIAEQARFTEAQREHREVVQDLQGSRFGWLAFILRLFKGDVLTRLVHTSNERASLAMTMDVHQAAAALLAQAADAARQRVTLLAAKVEALARAGEAARAQLDALETRLQSKPPFLTASADNWAVLEEWRKAHSDGSVPGSLILNLADPSASPDSHLAAIQAAAEQSAAAETRTLNIVTALEAEARRLGIPLDGETQNPLILVGEALLTACLETQPRFWLSPLAHPREFLFQVVAASTAPFDLTEGHTARFENGAPGLALSGVEGAAEGYLGFVHVQLGLAREDLEVYAQTRDAFLAAQADHNLFVIDDLAKQWNRRAHRRRRRVRARSARPEKGAAANGGE